MTWWQRVQDYAERVRQLVFLRPLISHKILSIFSATFRTSRVETWKPCSRCSKIQRNNCIFFDARKPVLPELKLRAFPLRICTRYGNCRRKWCCSCHRCIVGDTRQNAFVSNSRLSRHSHFGRNRCFTIDRCFAAVGKWPHTHEPVVPTHHLTKIMSMIPNLWRRLCCHCFCGHDTSSSPIFYADAPIQGHGSLFLLRVGIWNNLTWSLHWGDRDEIEFNE